MEKNSQQKNLPHERLLSLDILRGIAILSMIFLHNLAFHYAKIDELLAQDPLPLFITIFGFFIMWAGLFGVISGFANAYILLFRYYKLKDQENQDTASINQYLQIYMKKTWIRFLMIYIFHWIWTIGTGNSIVLEDPNDPALRASILIGLLYYGQYTGIHPELYYFSSSLWMIAINLLVVNLFIIYFLKRQKEEELLRSLFVAMIVILVASPILRYYLYPIFQVLSEGSGIQKVGAYFLSLLINDPQPAFPFLGYGFFGAIVGYYLVNGQEFKKIRYFLLIFGALLTVIGVIGYILVGGVVVADRNEIWGQSALYTTSIAYLQLGLFSFLFILILKWFEFSSSEKQIKLGKRFRLLSDAGQISLTMFIWEGVLAYIIRILIELRYPNWNNEILNIALFACGMVVIWLIITLIWRKFHFKYSLEWWMHKSKSKS